MLKQNQEDYLRAIYHLWEKDKQNIHSINIAKELKISKGAVSEMLKKLVKYKYIKMAPYSNIIFTKKGLKFAHELTHKHRIIEVFLKNIFYLFKKHIGIIAIVLFFIITNIVWICNCSLSLH